MAKRTTKKASTENVEASSKDSRVLDYARLVFKAPINEQRTVLYVVDGKSVYGVWTKSQALSAKVSADPQPKVYEVSKDGDTLNVEEI